MSQYLLALMAGVILPFAFAPVGFSSLALLSPLLLFGLWLHKTPKETALLSFIFGIGFFGVGASWVYVSIHEFGGTPLLLAGFFTALFVATLALFPTAQGYFIARFFPHNTLTKFYLALPASWVLIEYIRSIFGTGFPWLFLGASQTNSILFKGYLPVIGEYGVTYLVALCSALILLTIIKGWHNANKNILALLIIGFIGIVLGQVQWTSTHSQPFQVSLVQGNIPQQMKWTPNYLQPTLDHYLELTEPHWNSQLVIWPEAAVPALLQDVQPFIDNLRIKAAEKHTTIMLGVPIQDGFNYYNAMLLLNNNQQHLYYKRHLVPFGEYVPFAFILRGLISFFDLPMSNFSAGAQYQLPLKFNNINIAPYICYEIAYQQEVLPAFPQANLLVTISNDAWFGKSFASAQHLQIGQLRALEVGRFHLFTSNSGLTAIITPQGNIEASLPPYIAGVLTGTIQSMVGITPIVWLGTLPIIMLAGLLLGIAYWLQKK